MPNFEVGVTVQEKAVALPGPADNSGQGNCPGSAPHEISAAGEAEVEAFHFLRDGRFLPRLAVFYRIHIAREGHRVEALELPGLDPRQVGLGHHPAESPPIREMAQGHQPPDRGKTAVVTVALIDNRHRRAIRVGKSQQEILCPPQGLQGFPVAGPGIIQSHPIHGQPAVAHHRPSVLGPVAIRVLCPHQRVESPQGQAAPFRLVQDFSRQINRRGIIAVVVGAAAYLYRGQMRLALGFLQVAGVNRAPARESGLPAPLLFGGELLLHLLVSGHPGIDRPVAHGPEGGRLESGQVIPTAFDRLQHPLVAEIRVAGIFCRIEPGQGVNHHLVVFSEN